MPEQAANNASGEVQNASSATVMTTVGPREVVRCQHCSLVQFRTMSDLCRRCDQPLPHQLDPAVVEAEQQAALPATQESGYGDMVVRGKTMREFALGPRLKELREFRNMTQSQIAVKAKVPRTYVSRIEHSHLLPGLAVVERLADALGVQVLDLIPTRGANSGSADDPYWNSFVRYFRELRDDQKQTVLSKVRAMAGSAAPIHTASRFAPQQHRPEHLVYAPESQSSRYDVSYVG